MSEWIQTDEQRPAQRGWGWGEIGRPGRGPEEEGIELMGGAVCEVESAVWETGAAVCGGGDVKECEWVTSVNAKDGP